MKKKKKTTKKKSKLTEKKKEEPKKEDELPKKKTRKQETLQIIGIVAVIIVFFLAFIIPYTYIENQKTFKHGNVTWRIEQHGEITLYHAQFGKNYAGQYYGTHNTFFRNDPRTNDAQIDIGPISLQPKIVISQGPEALVCNRQVLVTDALSQITLAIPFITEKTLGTTSLETANKTGLNYTTCENKPQDTTIIQVEMGDEAKITENRRSDCYFVTIDKCENNLKVAEKFIFEIIKQLNTNE